MEKSVRRRGKSARRRQAVLAKPLHNQRVCGVQQLAAVVLVRPVDAVGPHVNFIAPQVSGGVVVDKLDDVARALAQPAPAFAGFAQGRVGAVPKAVLPYANGMPHFMQGCPRLLVAGAGAKLHIAAVAGLGRRRARAVAHRQAVVLYARQVVKVANRRFHSRFDALMVTLGARDAGAELKGNRPLRNRYHFDDVAIAHRVGIGDGVGAHVVHRGRRQIFYPVDVAVARERLGCTAVEDGRLRLLAPAKAVLQQVRCGSSRYGASPKSRSCPARMQRMGNNHRRSACAAGHPVGKDMQFDRNPGGCDGCPQLPVGRRDFRYRTR